MQRSLSVIGLFGILLGASVFNLAASGQAQRPAADSVPPIILNGLDALRQFGPDEAGKIMAKESSPVRSADSISNDLRSLQQYLGAFRSYEILSVRPISANTRIVYLTLNYEKEPRFARFDAYLTKNGWVLLWYKLDGDANWLRAELR